MVATSMPASRNAVKAAAGARKVNSLACWSPPSVIAVSRLTIVRSAAPSPAAASPNTVRGSRSRRSRTRPEKWTSPAKDIVNVPRGADDGAPGEPGSGAPGDGPLPDAPAPEPPADDAAVRVGSAPPVGAGDDAPSQAATSTIALATRNAHRSRRLQITGPAFRVPDRRPPPPRALLA